MLSAVRGSRAAPSPSIATLTPSASDRTTSLWSAHARPRVSNPGPRLADVAGTLTWTRTRLESRLRNHVNDGAAEPTGTHDRGRVDHAAGVRLPRDRKSTRLNSSHITISYAVFCLKKKN